MTDCVRKQRLKSKLMKSAFVLVCTAMLTAAGTVSKAYAQTLGGFSIKAVIPSNQIDKKQTYFDLLMKPGDEQEIELIISNSRKEELVADVSLNDASTGRNGIIVYTESRPRSQMLKVSATDVAVLESSRVVVAPQSSKTVKINIKMPDEPVEGVILGGIAVTEAKPNTNTSSTSGVSINNVITYAVALKITEDKTEIAPNFDIAAITPCLVNYKTAVSVALENKAPRIINNMSISAQIFRKGSDTPLYNLELDNAEMAPLSKGDFVIEWERNALKTGNYRLKMSAEYRGDVWDWDKEFSIAGEASSINRDAVGIYKDYRGLYAFMALALLVLIAVISYKIGNRNKRAQS